MSVIFRTKEDSPYSVEISGVGVLEANGDNGITAERAALRMPELQDEDGKPLTGNSLKSAAEKWAKAHNLETVATSSVDAETAAAAGGIAVSPVSIRDIASQAAVNDQRWSVGGQVAATAEPPVEVPPLAQDTSDDKSGRTETTTRKGQ